MRNDKICFQLRDRRTAVNSAGLLKTSSGSAYPTPQSLNPPTRASGHYLFTAQFPLVLRLLGLGRQQLDWRMMSRNPRHQDFCFGIHYRCFHLPQTVPGWERCNLVLVLPTNKSKQPPEGFCIRQCKCNVLTTT